MRPYIISILLILTSCSPKYLRFQERSNVLNLVNFEHKRMAGIKKPSPFSAYDKFVFETRAQVSRMIKLNLDTAQIEQFIVIDEVSFEGNMLIGTMIINGKQYFYSRLSGNEDVRMQEHASIMSDSLILQYLVDHKFKELKERAEVESKTTSGSNFYYIGMYEKGMRNVYVALLPVFIADKDE